MLEMICQTVTTIIKLSSVPPNPNKNSTLTCNPEGSGRVLSLQLLDDGIGHRPVEPSVLKPSHNAPTAILQSQALPTLPLF